MSRKEDFDSFQKRFNSSGKVGKNEFSIDGKSFDYRDPRNMKYSDGHYADRIGDDGSAEDYGNRNSYEYTNPLYDYSKGAVRDAAKELGIGNVNSKDEVKQLLKQIQSGSKSKAEDFKDDFIDKKITPPRENSDTEVEIPTGVTSGDATAGDNSIASSIAQNNNIGIESNRTRLTQNNKTEQTQNTDNNDNEALSFLDKYKLSLQTKENLDLSR